jgi:hypothetical protein
MVGRDTFLESFFVFLRGGTAPSELDGRVVFSCPAPSLACPLPSSSTPGSCRERLRNPFVGSLSTACSDLEASSWAASYCAPESRLRFRFETVIHGFAVPSSVSMLLTTNGSGTVMIKLMDAGFVAKISALL